MSLVITTPSFNITNLDRLAEVHSLILDHLQHVAPSTLLRLNHFYYDKYMYKVYETMVLKERAMEKIFVGLEYAITTSDVGDSNAEFFGMKASVLEKVRNLYICHTEPIAAIGDAHCQCQAAMIGTHGEIVVNPFFPTVQHLHISFEYLCCVSWVMSTYYHFDLDTSEQPVGIVWDIHEAAEHGQVLKEHALPESITMNIRGAWDILDQEKHEHELAVNAILSPFLNIADDHAPLIHVGLDVYFASGRVAPFIPHIYCFENDNELPDLLHITFLRARSGQEVTYDSRYSFSDRFRVTSAIWNHYLQTRAAPRAYWAAYFVEDVEGIKKDLERIQEGGKLGMYNTRNDIISLQDLIRPLSEGSRCHCPDDLSDDTSSWDNFGSEDGDEKSSYSSGGSS